jgi:hypothetical protein
VYPDKLEKKAIELFKHEIKWNIKTYLLYIIINTKWTTTHLKLMINYIE